jgi:hypothetical protein
VRGRAGRAAAVVGVLAGTIGTTAGCWVTGECSGFALSIAIDSGGQDSPEAAAEAFSDTGTASVPGSGWRQVGTDDGGVRLRSGEATLHVTRLSDGTWTVVSGTTC